MIANLAIRWRHIYVLAFEMKGAKMCFPKYLYFLS